MKLRGLKHSWLKVMNSYYLTTVWKIGRIDSVIDGVKHVNYIILTLF